jgi:hypothetical protein
MLLASVHTESEREKQATRLKVMTESNTHIFETARRGQRAMLFAEA